MIFALIIAIVCLVCALMFAPIVLRVKAHFSLFRKGLQMDISVLGLRIIRLRFKLSNGRYVFTLNGKDKKIATGKKNNKYLQNILSAISNKRLAIVASIYALISVDDAKDGAILCALIETFDGCKAYQSFASEQCEIDAQVKLKTNAVQVAGLLSEK